ncbi:MAG: hypothetical protein FWF60_08365 [Oscillospiraceae bacterium]|nr:hypothetical protein [Oscillospiraceae bacterium]
MRSNYVLMSLLDNYRGVENALDSNKPLLFRLLNEHISWDEIIPFAFYRVFYKRFGRARAYHLESFLRMLLVQRVFHYIEDSQLFKHAALQPGNAKVLSVQKGAGCCKTHAIQAGFLRPNPPSVRVPGGTDGPDLPRNGRGLGRHAHFRYHRH